MEKILVLLHLDETGTSLPKSAFEAVNAALTLGSPITIGIIGDNVQSAADSLASTGARILAVSGPEFSQPRYASDAAAAAALCRAAEATLVIAPSTSRFSRVMPGVSYRLNGTTETHITGLNPGQSKDLTVTRWFYRQRIEATLSRTTRPWFLLLEPGIEVCGKSSCGDGLPNPSNASAARASLELISVTTNSRTTITGIRSPKTGSANHPP